MTELSLPPPAGSSRSSNRLVGVLPAGVFLLTGGLMMALSWQRWIDPLIDIGTQFYVAWRLAEGDTLYKDIEYAYGPLAAYLNALLFKIAGPGIQTLVFFNIGLIAILTGILYNLFCRMATRLTAVLAGTGFLSLSAFSQYLWMGNHNFVISYVYDLTYGAFLSFLCLDQFGRYLERRELPQAGIVGFLAGLVLLTKVEVFFALFGALVVGMGIFLNSQTFSGREKWKHAAFFCLMLAFPASGSILFLGGEMPLQDAWFHSLKPIFLLFESSVTQHIFYKRVMGFDQPWDNLLAMGGQFAAWVVILGGITLIARFGQRFLRAKGLASLFLPLMVAGAIYLGVVKPHLLNFLRPLPLLCLVAAVLAWRQLKSHPEDHAVRARQLLILVFSTFSFLLTLKLVLNIHIYHYGSVLALPGLLITIKLLIDDLPQWAAAQQPFLTTLRNTFALLVIFIFIGHIAVSNHFYQMKVFPITEGPDRMLGYHPEITNRDILFRFALEDLSSRLKPEDTLAVLPVGTIFNYLLRKRNPISVTGFNPLTPLITETQFIQRQFEQTPPTYVLITFHDYLEFDTRFFGVDFGKDFYDRLQEHYEEIKVIGSHPVRDRQFGFVLFKKGGNTRKGKT